MAEVSEDTVPMAAEPSGARIRLHRHVHEPTGRNSGETHPPGGSQVQTLQDRGPYDASAFARRSWSNPTIRCPSITVTGTLLNPIRFNSSSATESSRTFLSVKGTCLWESHAFTCWQDPQPVAL